jgi:hypothetical protein
MLARLQTDVTPLHYLLAMMLGAAQTQLIRVAAEIGLADLVKHGPQSIDAGRGDRHRGGCLGARLARARQSRVLAEAAPDQYVGPRRRLCCKGTIPVRCGTMRC